MIRKPDWLKMQKRGEGYTDTAESIRTLKICTVCQEAKCPNQNECFSKKTAAFMILGDECTRDCRFCAVQHTPKPNQPDPTEPDRIAKAVKKLQLRYVVVTSVTRDDLADGGSGHFSSTIREIRKQMPQVSIEVLIPDFQGNPQSLNTIIQAEPWVINHNVETIERLYPYVRSQANFTQSLQVLNYIKNHSSIATKSGFMVGLGETEEEIVRLMESLRNVNCDFLTIGQYLQPSLNHFPVKEYIPPSTFDRYEKIALNMGFKYVASGPLVRSSYHAIETLQFKTSAI